MDDDNQLAIPENSLINNNQSLDHNNLEKKGANWGAANLSEREKGIIIALRSRGLTHREIAQSLKRDISTIQRFLARAADSEDEPLLKADKIIRDAVPLAAMAQIEAITSDDPARRDQASYRMLRGTGRYKDHQDVVTRPIPDSEINQGIADLLLQAFKQAGSVENAEFTQIDPHSTPVNIGDSKATALEPRTATISTELISDYGQNTPNPATPDTAQTGSVSRETSTQRAIRLGLMESDATDSSEPATSATEQLDPIQADQIAAAKRIETAIKHGDSTDGSVFAYDVASTKPLDTESKALINSQETTGKAPKNRAPSGLRLLMEAQNAKVAARKANPGAS